MSLRHKHTEAADDLEQLSPGGSFEKIRNDDFDDEDDPHEKRIAFASTNDYWADTILTWY